MEQHHRPEGVTVPKEQHMSRHRFPICQTTGKVRFRERKDVKLALRHADRRRSQALLDGVACNRREVQGYSCSECNGWHLTSQPVRPVRLAPFVAAHVATPTAHVSGPAAEAMRRMATATGVSVGVAA
jgi:hypothetical protein